MTQSIIIRAGRGGLVAGIYGLRKELGEEIVEKISAWNVSYGT